MVKSGRHPKASTRKTVQCQTALVTRIALFLKILSKENFQRLLKDTARHPIPSEGHLLKLMIAKGYISPKDAPNLKKTCLSFARAQKDTRFGSLCMEFGFVTQSNLDLALEEQKRLSEAGRTVYVGDLLVANGMISEQQQKLILQKQKLDLDFRGSAPENQTKEIRENGIIFCIPENGMQVYCLREDKSGSLLSPEEFKDILDDLGIIYGLAEDPALENFLSDERFAENRFELAKGLEPLPGTDAQISYMFEQDYLSPGKMAEDGTIDYKTRGTIPFVKAGDVLAEKIPGKIGRDGLNVFGSVIKAGEPFDNDLKCGKGACLSGDGLIAYAETSGYPKLSKDGVISVNNAHVIRGDVDFNTGHIQFSKNVFITGTIKSGFRVEAEDVVARAVDGGIIHAKGDVVVTNGISNSVVNAEGSVTAGFVYKSTVNAMGDADIAKEVAESRISLQGTFDMYRGKMYASHLSARGGARIYRVGSIKALPSTIEVGTSPFLNKTLKTLDKEIKQSQNFLEETGPEMEAVQGSREDIDREILRLEKVSMSGEHPPDLPREVMSNTIIGLKAESLAFQKQERRLEREREKHRKALKQCTEMKAALEEKAPVTPPRPILDVKGKLLAGTVVKGQHSSTQIAKDLSRVRIMEMSSTTDGETRQKIWEMITTRL